MNIDKNSCLFLLSILCRRQHSARMLCPPTALTQQSRSASAPRKKKKEEKRREKKKEKKREKTEKRRQKEEKEETKEETNAIYTNSRSTAP